MCMEKSVYGCQVIPREAQVICWKGIKTYIFISTKSTKQDFGSLALNTEFLRENPCKCCSSAHII